MKFTVSNPDVIEAYSRGFPTLLVIKPGHKKDKMDFKFGKESEIIGFDG